MSRKHHPNKSNYIPLSAKDNAELSVGSSSEEETFFTSSSIVSRKINNPRKGTMVKMTNFFNRNRGIAYGLGGLLIFSLIVLLVAAITFHRTNLPSVSSLNNTGTNTNDTVTTDSSSQTLDSDTSASVVTNKQNLSWSIDLDSSMSEMSLLEYDINRDGISDIIIDSMTWRMGDGKYLACPEKPNACQADLGFSPCRAKLLALDGSNGSIIWEKWVEFSTFAANCKHDLNLDGVPDCTFSGRVGLLAAINPVDGSYIWIVDPAVTYPMYSYYSPLFIHDFDRDGIIDLIVTHGGDPTYNPTQKVRSPGFIFVISGRTGQQLSERIPMPDGHETYSSPVAYNVSDVELVLFGSGGETVTGSLWAISVGSLQRHVDEWTPNRAERYRANKLYFDPLCLSLKEIYEMRPHQLDNDNAFKYLKKKEYWMTLCAVYSSNSNVMWNPYKLCVYEFLQGRLTGNMQPPVVVDYDGDDVQDLLVSQFNDNTLLIDGISLNVVWNHSVPNTQSYSIPAPLHFNEDDKLDFVVRLSKGKWMFYDYSYMGVLDGDNGELIWALNCSTGAMSSPITAKSKKKGHDGMLFLANGCENPTNHVSERDSNSVSEKNEDIFGQGHTDSEYMSCKSQKKKKRHEESSSGSEQDSENYFSDIVESLPADLWEARNEDDAFPDPWTDTRSFIQEYCDIPYDSMVNRVYYLTPNMIKAGYTKPIFENRPYVYKPPASGYLIRKKRGNEETEDVLKERKDTRCAHILLPWKLQTTPIIGDFDKDGRLDAATSVLFDGMPNELYRLSVFHPPKVSVKTFNIEDKLIEVFGSNIKNIVDFSSYYAANKQPWKQYMGSRGDGLYQPPTTLAH